MNLPPYKKRAGTSGIRGQLYETKLISLIYFRAKHADNVKEFYLATNMDEIGTFDDICFRARVKNFKKPLAVFIQAKHRENDKVLLTLNSRNDLAKYFDSYLNIRRAFKPNNKDIIFKGNFDEMECFFIMYTTAGDDLNNELYESGYASDLNKLIKTGNAGLKPRYKKEHVEYLSKIILKQQFSTLAEQMAKFLSEDTDSIMSMNDDLVLSYHIILAQKVFDVSEIQRKHEDEEHRIASFRHDFFKTDEEFIILFRDTLYSEILKRRKLEETEINKLLSTLFTGTFDVTLLGKLIYTVITYDNGKFDFVTKVSGDLKRKLDKVVVTPTTVDEATVLAAKEMLTLRQIKVPASFGNKDLTIRGKVDINIENRLDYLKLHIFGLLINSKPDNIVNIDESLGDEFLQLNGGIASAIGNILVSDENSKLIKFTENCELLGDLAKRLFNKVKSKINQNLHDYRFDIKVKKFPKLLFESGDHDENVAMLKDHLNSLAVMMAKFLNEDADCVMSINNELMERYHVILAQKVIDVSKIHRRHKDEEHRIASFRQDFFKTDEEFIILFRDTLFSEILKRRKLEGTEINSLLSTLFTGKFDVTLLGKLIGTVIMYENGKFVFINKASENLKRQLDKVVVPQTTVNEAIVLAAKEMLTLRQFKVPASFGNKDLTIADNLDNIENRLDNLKLQILSLLINSKPDNIVSIDESLSDEFLQLNGGIASAIGNILVSDENTKLMKFTDNCELLEDLAKRLFTKLESKINLKLHHYRFDIKVKKFPKLLFDDGDNYENLDMLKDHLTILANMMAKFLNEEADCIMPMNDELMLRYHVILAQKVLNVSDIQRRNEDGEHRIATFRQDFFDTDNELLIIFKSSLYTEIVRKRKLDDTDSNNLLSTFLKGTSETNVSQSTVHEAIEIAARDMLTWRQFKVPAAFGNKDLTIRGEKGVKIERRLNHLNMKIAELINNSKANNLVTIDESLGDGLLKLNGGIAGVVGNMLVSDEKTKLMKFTDNCELLGDLSKRLFEKLQCEIHNLHKFRFDVKVKKFPKLSFEGGENDVNLARDFLSKLLFFTNQADESDVEEILKSEIEDDQSNNVNSIRVTSDAIFLTFHDEIQKWWMLKEGSYLTKESKMYEKAIENIVTKPLMTLISMMYMIKIKHYVEYSFNKNAMPFFMIQDQLTGSVVITESSALTVTKFIQCLINKDLEYILLDLEYILNLQANDYNTVRTELTNTNKEKVLIIVCDNLPNTRNWCKRLENIAKAVNDKRAIVVTNKTLVEMIKKYFSQADKVVYDGKINLMDMSEESRKIILKDARVIFQGQELCLDLFVDDVSMRFIEGNVLNNIINNESVKVSDSISNSNYEKFKHLYIDRRVCCIKNLTPNVRRFGNAGKVLITLYDNEDDIALITAKPGMGKSTLLTHLSLRTKEIDPNVWIVRINLLDYSQQFGTWQKNKTPINTLETLNFMSQIILNEKRSMANYETITLEESNGVVNLKDCTGNELTVFELKMFLHFYNRKNIIFLFDGFDEICPNYTHEVLNFIKVVESYPRRHKMWITTRPYDKIKAILELEFGTLYEIQHFSDTEQGTYLCKFWKSNIIFTDLNKEQFDNINTFMEFISFHYHDSKEKTNIKKEKHQILFIKVCLNFLGYLKININSCPPPVINIFNTLFSGCNHVIRIIEDFDTPLHLYLIAEYLLHQIIDVSNKTNKWHLDINAFTIYERFFETKLKKIRFEEKNKIDLYKPDNMIIYEDVRKDFFAKHRKLGAYAIFYQDVNQIFNMNELIEINDILDKIKKGREKTGLINSVGNSIPTFIHMTFTEYFAVEYVCDLLKKEICKDRQKSIWDFILNVILLKCNENVRNILGYKVKMDDTLRTIVKENEEIIFDLLLTQGKGVYTYYVDDFSKELYLKIKVSLCEAMKNDLCNFVTLLYKLKIKFTQDYLTDPSRCTSKIKRLKLLHKIHTKKKSIEQSQGSTHRSFAIQNNTV